MAHALETASSGRARCRGCGQPIGKGEERLGERLPSPYADREMTLWFHPVCGAYKRPDVMLAAVDACDAGNPAHAGLRALASAGLVHRRVPRLDGAEQAPSGQARCRSCRAAIAKGAWRARLTFFNEGGRFTPGGFVHLGCVRAYCALAAEADVQPIVARLLYFSTGLDAAAAEAVRTAVAKGAPAAD